MSELELILEHLSQQVFSLELNLETMILLGVIGPIIWSFAKGILKMVFEIIATIFVFIAAPFVFLFNLVISSKSKKKKKKDPYEYQRMEFDDFEPEQLDDLSFPDKPRIPPNRKPKKPCTPDDDLASSLKQSLLD